MKFLPIVFFITNVAFAQEVVTYKSVWKKNEIELQAELFLPENRKEPYPVIFAMHSSGPDIPLLKIKGKTDIYADSLKKHALSRGYAVVMMESFDKRGVVDLWSNLEQVSSHVSKFDAFKLAKTLEKDSRLDKKNFFITGHSYGGAVAMDSAYGTQGQQLFNSVVASAPGCHIVRDMPFTATVMIIIGENDKTVSYIPCKKLENQAAVIVVKDMSHSFSTYGDQYSPQGENMMSCADKVFVRHSLNTFKMNDKVISAADYRSACIRKGTYGGGARDKLNDVIVSALNFFDKNLKKD